MMNNDKILRLIPNFRFTDEYERQQLLHDYARFSPWLFMVDSSSVHQTFL